MRSLSILLIEDSADDAELLLLELRRFGFDVAVCRVSSVEELQKALAGGVFDLVLADYSMPGLKAETALQVVQQSASDLSFVIVSGTVGEETAVAMMRAGASDYVLKGRLQRIGPIIERELKVTQSRRSRRIAEQQIRELAAIVRSSDDAIISHDLQGTITSWNPGAERLLGMSSAQAAGQNISILSTILKGADLKASLSRLQAGEAVERLETEWRKHDGSGVEVALTISPLHDEEGAISGVSIIARDITERLRQQQALERSEAWHRLLVESFPHVIWMAAPGGDADYLNRLGEERLGVAADSISAMKWLDLVHSEDRARAREAWCAAVKSESIYRTEYRVRVADGSYRWYLSQAVPLRPDGGAVQRWVGTWTDIDDFRRADAALTRTADLLNAVAESSPDAIFVKDLEGRYLLINPAAARFMGHRAEDILGKEDDSFFSPADAALIGHNDRRVMETGRQETSEEELTSAGGRRVYLATKFPYRDRDGKISGLVGISRDITDRKHVEAALRDSEERFRTFMDHSPALAWITDEDGRLIYVNATYSRIVKLNAPAPEGLSMFDLFPREIAEVYLQNIRKVIAAGRVVEAIEPGIRLDGTPCEFLVYKFPLPSVDGPALVGGMALDITDRKRTEEALLLRDRAIGAATQGILITDPLQEDNPITFVSPGFERLTGYSADEVLGRNCRFLQGAKTDPSAKLRIRKALRAGQAISLEILNYRKNGQPFWNALSVSPVHDAKGKLTHFIGVQTDVTERRQLEEQVRGSQKMEAVGQLAGGIAHDFNNFLTVINGYSDVLLQTLPTNSPIRETMLQIRKAGERSADLTNQLLTFSRRQMFSPRIVDLNAVLIDSRRMLRQIVGEDVEFVINLEPKLESIWADPGQLQQLLMNLVVNARDAMPAGGRLTLETANVLVDETFAESRPDASVGPYVMLTMSDTGTGMSQEVLARAFDPFFTTKPSGKGTGLGLAVVHGIVRQSDGFIALDSAVGKGTVFRIFLPVAQAVEGDSVEVTSVIPSVRGSETILLVEDDDGVRGLSRQILAAHGFTVLEAAHGEEALTVAKKFTGEIHLLVTDVVMPGLSGGKLAEQLLQNRPDMQVLFVSGYADDAVVRHGVLHELVHFLQKPFAPAALAMKAREALDTRL
ncbi:PAS domain S-box protein [Planctomicrobium piriforme]|uniref:histidine kinase n=1 Tax=Planctomicrobium piriforme TaxID=1576369 RepID=A0A1I3GL41_9PLAN|nr:PAS domain S-box protein [Planctomicrobium piriforme]SFI24173.1 PAS domain S-box-containing protein [Planctomicrobium piriforme]